MSEKAMDQQMFGCRTPEVDLFLKNEHDAAHFTHSKPRRRVLLLQNLQAVCCSVFLFLPLDSSHELHS